MRWKWVKLKPTRTYKGVGHFKGDDGKWYYGNSNTRHFKPTIEQQRKDEIQRQNAEERARKSKEEWDKFNRNIRNAISRNLAAPITFGEVLLAVFAGIIVSGFFVIMLSLAAVFGVVGGSVWIWVNSFQNVFVLNHTTAGVIITLIPMILRIAAMLFWVWRTIKKGKQQAVQILITFAVLNIPYALLTSFDQLFIRTISFSLLPIMVTFLIPIIKRKISPAVEEYLEKRRYKKLAKNK